MVKRTQFLFCPEQLSHQNIKCFVLVLSTSNNFGKCTGYIFCVSTWDSLMPYYTSWHDTFGFGKLSQRSKCFVKGNQPFCEDSHFYTRHSGEHDYLLHVYGKICFWRSWLKFSVPFVSLPWNFCPFNMSFPAITGFAGVSFFNVAMFMVFMHYITFTFFFS